MQTGQGQCRSCARNKVSRTEHWVLFCVDMQLAHSLYLCPLLPRCSRSSVLSTASMPLTCAAAMHARDLNF